MLYVILVLTILSVGLKVGCTVLVAAKDGKAGFLQTNPMGSCTIVGPMLPKGAPLGTTVHEWVHMITLAPYWVIAMQFSWVLFWSHGWLVAILLGMVLNIAAMITLEGVADIGAVCVVGPRAYMKELIAIYRKVGVTKVLMFSTLLCYPVWRLYPMLVVWGGRTPEYNWNLPRLDVDALVKEAFANVRIGGINEED